MSIQKEQLDIFFSQVLMKIQWQKLTHCRYQLAERKNSVLIDNVFQGYHKGKISSSELCRHFKRPDSELFRLLVEKGELFGD